MLSSLYDDTSSETSQVSTPKRRKHSTMTTPRAGGRSTGKTPFKSPYYLTPLRSSAKKNPIVEQVHATVNLFVRIFTSKILFIGSFIFLIISLTLFFIKAKPYWNPEKCNAGSQYRIRSFCLNNSDIHGNISKTITRIVKKESPRTFDSLYSLVSEKENLTEQLFNESLQYCDEVAVLNDIIYYKLSDNAEIFLLFLFSAIVFGLFVTCCIFFYRNRSF